MIPVIIPFYKNQAQLDKCLRHLDRQTVDVEIFVRDNSHDNIYFTRAVNEGIRKFLDQDWRYIIALNQDMYLEPNAVEEIVKFMDSTPQCGIGSPLEHLSSQAEGEALGGGLEAFPLGIHQSGSISDLAKPEQIFWANGSCMIFRKAMIREIGLLDENFIFICSDSDYCFTARTRGWEVWRIGTAHGLHEHGASGATTNLEIELLKINDLLYFARKWLTGNLYKQVAYKGAECTGTQVQEEVNKFRQARSRIKELLGKQSKAAPGPPGDKVPDSAAPDPTEGLATRLRSAVRHLQAGRLDQAEDLYRQVLEKKPNLALALHSLGLIAYQRQQYEDAAEFVSQAICAAPQDALLYNTMGVISDALKKSDQAMRAYSKAVKLKPDYAEAHKNLALVYQHIDRYEEAIASFQQAISLTPNDIESPMRLADLLRVRARYAEAVVNYQRVIELAPDTAEAHNNLAICLKEQGCFSEAITAQRHALELAPEAVDFYINMAGILQSQGALAEAMTTCQQAIKLNPENANAYYSLACVQRDAGKIDDAIVNNQQAIELEPDWAPAHWNQAVCHLLAGQFSEAWKQYRWRHKVGFNLGYPHVHPQAHWDGSCFAGKRLLVHCEQGYGDAIQFARYLPLVKSRGGDVIFGVWEPLAELAAKLAGVDEVAAMTWDTPPDCRFDLRISIMDLPALFGTTLEDIDGRVPYASVDPAKLHDWQQQLSTKQFKLGIAWAGSPKHANDRNRSCPLDLFEPLMQLEDVALYSLQRDVSDIRVKHQLENLGIRQIADRFVSFADTGAAISNLDLIITVDTAVLHLAGALGLSTWGLIPYSPDWRWMQHRDDSPWYPTLRLFRQPQPGDWQSVMNRITHELPAAMASAGRR
jgi:tetratricopeptide (TPR) repeat protein